LKKKTEIDNNMKTLEHIEDYLLGNLSAEEQKAFEAKLANDKELQEQVELQRILITEVQAFNAVQAAEAAYLEEQQEETKIRASIISPNQKESFEENVAAFFVEEVEEKKPSSKVITWNFKRIASIAACLLICIGGYNVWLQQ
jgi:anti-sigma factor RsiW